MKYSKYKNCQYYDSESYTCKHPSSYCGAYRLNKSLSTFSQKVSKTRLFAFILFFIVLLSFIGVSSATGTYPAVDNSLFNFGGFYG